MNEFQLMREAEELLVRASRATHNAASMAALGQLANTAFYGAYVRSLIGEDETDKEGLKPDTVWDAHDVEFQLNRVGNYNRVENGVKLDDFGMSLDDLKATHGPIRYLLGGSKVILP